MVQFIGGLIGLIVFFSWLLSLDWSWFWSLLTILGWLLAIVVAIGVIAAICALISGVIREILKPKLSPDELKKLEADRAADIAESKALAKQRNAQALERNAQALARFNSIIGVHKNELLSKRRQYIEDKGYGIIDKSKWESEKVCFINSVLRVHAKIKDDVKYNSETFLKEKIECRLNELASKSTEAPPLGKPIEFEHYCASELERTGWRVSTTKASGDQGADVIAKKGKVKVVLQCKQYSKPVGNAAVQEAHSAKSHYSADFAVVVTNKSYTKSAKQLAVSTGVLLLHQDELADLDSLL